MGKKIIVLNGSPRKNGNTSALVKAFREGAESAGHTVTEFWLGGMKINGCRGCCAGGKNPESPCVQKDDFDIVRGRLVDADMIVFATPVYYFGVSAQLKTVVDRFYSIHGKLGGKKCALISVFGNPSSKTAEPAVAMYRAMTAFLGWEDMGMILAAGVCAKGDVLSTDYGRQAYEMGRNIK